MCTYVHVYIYICIKRNRTLIHIYGQLSIGYRLYGNQT